MDLPPVNHIAVPEGYLAWQLWPSSDPDADLTILNLGQGFMDSMEDAADELRLLRWLHGLAGIGRMLRLDLPGVGASDVGSTPPTLADWADAAARVLDAAGVEQVAVTAAGPSVLVALAFVERHPHRVSSLALVNGAAKITWAEDYPIGVDLQTVSSLIETARDPTTATEADHDLAIQGPSAMGDPQFRSWWRRVARRNLKPRIAGAVNAALFGADFRGLLPLVEVPTLVVARADTLYGTAMAEYVAERVPDSTYVELPGADMLPFLGDATAILDELREHFTGRRYASTADRIFAAVLFTDLVGSTTEVVRMGDERWRALLLDHVAMVRAEVDRHGGRMVQDLGDGTLCAFPLPSSAIRCALAMVTRARVHLGMDMRAGIHAGEVEVRGEDLAGINVHTAARVSGAADGGDVLVSSTVVDLVAGSTFDFEDRGSHELKGVPRPRRLWRVTPQL